MGATRAMSRNSTISRASAAVFFNCLRQNPHACCVLRPKCTVPHESDSSDPAPAIVGSVIPSAFERTDRRYAMARLEKSVEQVLFPESYKPVVKTSPVE